MKTDSFNQFETPLGTTEKRSAQEQPPKYLQSPCLAHRALHQFLLELVVLVYDVELSQLLLPTRGRKRTAFARQVAMYLAHTSGGLSLSGVGRLFKRDRTTVAHACALVEDARDDTVFDRTLDHLESAIACQMDMFRLSNQNDGSRMVQKYGQSS
jgi:hypothetical protein